MLYNQVNSNQAANIDEYEKSVFLTKAEHEFVKAYFDPRSNKLVEGFDGSEKRQYDFSTLVINTQLNEVTPVSKYDPRSIVYLMPEDMFLVLNESVVESGLSRSQYIYQVIPISYAEYQRLMQKLYQYPAKRQVWRLITGNQYYVQTESSSSGSGSSQEQNEEPSQDSTNDRGTQSLVSGTVCEIIGRFGSNSLSYNMRYVKKPYPIILVNLDTEYNGLTIDGYHGNPSDEDIADANGGISCKLPEGVHHEIVQRAVELATAVYNPQALGSIAGVGNVSSTDIGIVPRQEGR